MSFDVSKTMQYLEKYLAEGLIQMAILLSLCGLMVDVGLEPYFPASWHERILGPTSTLTQTQFHNLRNRLEDGHGLHPKHVDLDNFFTARRLLGWVHSLDRLQVPQAELETWLVQREHEPLPAGLPIQAPPLTREPPGIERVQLAPSLESRPSLATLHEEGDDEEEENEEEQTYAVLHHGGALDDGGEAEEVTLHQHVCFMEREGPGSFSSGNDRALAQDEQAFSSLQECLRLLDESFPLEEEQQLHDAGGGRGELVSSILHSTNPSLDLELHWQDLFAIMEPQHSTESDVSSSSMTERFEAPHQLTQADLGMETRWQQGSLGPPEQLEPQPTLLLLTPTEELEDHRSAFASVDTGSSLLQNPPDHMDLFTQDPSQGFCLGFGAEDNMNLLTRDLVARSSHPENVLYSSHMTTFQEGNALTQDLLVSPSGDFLFGEDEDGLPSPLNDLMEDAAILDEIRLLDLALEEGFSPEMAARLDDDDDDDDVAQQHPGRDEINSQSDFRGDQVLPGDSQQDSENGANSDSGLSLDFSHSPASPDASSSSFYSSSSSDSAEHSPFSEDEDTQELCDGPHLEMEVMIKQEEEEEELGAVGGRYHDGTKPPFGRRCQDEKLFGSFPWQEHIGHDHTYNQPSSSPPLPVGKMSTKQARTWARRPTSKPYHDPSSHASSKSLCSHDERRARALKVPFSNELIVNLPVEEFNHLLASFQLDEEQLALIKDIRRRGKNKVAAQNCRRRKMDVLLGLSGEVSTLRRRRSRLLREKQEAMRSLQEMKHRLNMLHQEVFSRLMDEEGRPLSPVGRELRFAAAAGSITVASSRQGGAQRPAKSNRKQRDKSK